MFSRRKSRRNNKKVDNVEDEEEQQHPEDEHEEQESRILELPELLLESILERLPSAALCRMGAACRQLRQRCSSNHLWQSLFYEKWGKVAGSSAFQEWQRSLLVVDHHDDQEDHRKKQLQQQQQQQAGGFSSLWIWPLLSCILPICSSSSSSKQQQLKVVHHSQRDSLMAWYSALQSGSFWFPAQVYNRENGHVGFMLSCYDAQLSYRAASDSFRARYPPHGQRTAVVEEHVQWERVRAPPVETAAHELHVSENLEQLRPGDHIEVQWRRSKDFPYGWWYGVVGHTETCERNYSCQCISDDVLWLEFNQYTMGSRWRRAPIKRKIHCEEGNDAEGFYGGVRKIRSKEDISIWSKLWPSEILE